MIQIIFALTLSITSAFLTSGTELLPIVAWVIGGITGVIVSALINWG